MDDSSSISSWITLLVLLSGNVLLAIGHNALVNSRKADLSEQAETGNKRAALALALGEDATNLLLSYQLSVTILRFLAAGVAVLGLAPGLAAAFINLGLENSLAYGLARIILLLFTAAVMLTLGEQVPATFGAANAERLALIVARPMQLVVRTLTPLSWILRLVSDTLIRLLGVEGKVHYVTEEEIKTIVDAGQEEGVLETHEKEMIFSIIELDNTTAREVMVPRLDMVALAIDTPLDEAVQEIIDAGHSRIPVYEDNIDHIRGLLYAKDLLQRWGNNEGDNGNGDAVRNLLREAYFVPEGKSAMTLLGEMRQDRIHLAIVVDEYGGTAGLVTLEDLIEEIIGEIQDEYDIHEQATYRQLSEDEYICNARLDLDDLNRLLDLHFPTDEYDTLGGFIFYQVGEVPAPGTVIETHEARLEVLTVDGRRIRNVRVTRLPARAHSDTGSHND